MQHDPVLRLLARSCPLEAGMRIHTRDGHPVEMDVEEQRAMGATGKRASGRNVASDGSAITAGSRYRDPAGSLPVSSV